MNIPVGKHIRKFRMMRGMTQKALGKAVGFSSRSASVRIAQYECGARTPKLELLKQIADVLHVSVDALTTPDFENAADLMHCQRRCDFVIFRRTRNVRKRRVKVCSL